MPPRRAAALALIALLGALVAVPSASVGSAGGPAGPPVTASLAGNAAGTNASLGTQVAAFVTAGVETAGENVEREMWLAAYERSDNRSARAALVDSRTATIESRLAALEAEKRELVRQRRNGEIELVVYRARMSALAARLAALRRSINGTAPRAAAVGADPAKVRALRERARNASGPQLRRARSLGGGPLDRTAPGQDGQPDPGEDPPGQDGRQPGGSDGPPTRTATPADGDCPGTPGGGPGDRGTGPSDVGNATYGTGSEDC